MPVHEFNVEMSCGGCASAIEKILGKLGDKVEKVSVNLEEQKVSVTSNLPSDEILQALRKSGKTVSYIGVKK